MHAEFITWLAVTGAVTSLLLGAYYCAADWLRPSLEERVVRLAHREATRERSEEASDSRLLAVLAPRLSQPLKPRTELEQQKLRLRLARAGFNSNHATEVFLCLKVMCALGGAAAGFTLAPLLATQAQSWLIGTAFGACLGLFVPDLVLRSLTLQRQQQITLALPNAIDLLIVAIEVGQGLDAAIAMVTKQIARNSRALSQEFSLYSLHLRMGKPRSEALHEFGLRSGVPDMQSFATILVQADRFGASIAKTLQQVSDSGRRKRRQRAEERAQKTAVQMILPLVLFIFPGIFVVLVGPALLMLWRDLSSMY